MPQPSWRSPAIAGKAWWLESGEIDDPCMEHEDLEFIKAAWARQRR
ncbi:predicted protein [Plenodomus lingam JN3]|uniref:Predicted protein n=1 Tax=Leptosphaeria maculans (strain JN3 / isolate v23.1.3 / race Av1-4-5-6-7-8) TaxID=985895 RepID=E5ACM8_LEPMJ|nr:predicted protein [Plenodomus lingam JN3]CBY02230.1 predicted protein [Plenodomus lingam JN3]